MTPYPWVKLTYVLCSSAMFEDLHLTFGQGAYAKAGRHTFPN
jgi:hypothetical protein